MCRCGVCRCGVCMCWWLYVLVCASVVCAGVCRCGVCRCSVCRCGVYLLPVCILLVPRPHSAQIPNVSLSGSLLQDLSCGRTILAGVGSVESSYLVQSAPCVKTPDHPDLPAILVLIEYLGALEVPVHTPYVLSLYLHVY